MESASTHPDTLRTATSVVYLNYNIDVPPVPPPAEWTRFVCISDTHSQSFPVPPGDVLLHSGDLTELGLMEDFELTANWLYSLPHPVKIIIAGNHDFPLHESWYKENYQRWHGHRQNPVNREEVMELLQGPKAQTAGIVYLEDQRYEFCAKEGGRAWSVYGSPWSPYFGDWAFNYKRETESQGLIDAFPQADILLTHGPPFSILDLAQERNPVGCETLLRRLPELKPKLHVFGHIHEARGVEIRANSSEDGLDDHPLPADSEQDNDLSHTIFVNAANAPAGSRARDSESRRKAFGDPGFQPIIVDLLDSVHSSLMTA